MDSKLDHHFGHLWVPEAAGAKFLNDFNQMAERVGFEPTVPTRSTSVFETDPIDRSGTSPESGPSL